MATNDVTEQEAKRLGFKPPSAPPKIGAPTPHATTNVIGYWNPNPWPVHIAISQLGLSIHLEQRGHYVVDREGNKINDPILESYVGPNQLNRETSTKPLPIRFFARPVEAARNDRNVVREAVAFRQTSHGVQPVMAPVRPEAPAMPVHGTPVVGMPVEEARRLGLIRPTVEPLESNVEDTKGAPARGEMLVTLDAATPRDMKPGEYQRWLAAQKAQTIVQDDITPQPAPVNTTALHASLPVTIPESESQAEIQAQLVEAAGNTKILDDAVAAAMHPTPAPAVPQPLEDLNLPRPEIPGVAPAPVAAPKPKFVCAVDGREFEFRSQLKHHVKSKYPEREAELMEPYPDTRRQT